MHFTRNTLLLATMGAGALARPSLHHRHQQFHDAKRAVGDTVIATIDGQVVSWVNEFSGEVATAVADGVSPSATTTAASTTATSAEASATSSADSSSSESSSATASASSSSSTGASSYTSFCSSSKKRATAAEIAYTGDTGTSSDWGCNQMLIDSSLVNDYDYTIKFSGQNTEDWKCVCWNKIGPDGGINGWFGHSAVEFTLASGAEQYVAFDSNSQGGCACGESSVPTDGNGEWAATWVEFDFGNTSNDGWSGTDASALVVQTAGMSVQGLKVTHDSCSSTILSDGSGTNAYTSGMENDDGVGCNIPAGSAHLEVTIDYSG